MSLESDRGRADLAGLIGEDNAGVLAMAGKLGRERSVRVFLVGGLVRDLYLKVGSVDLDLAVEGDGLAFARRLSALLGAQIVEYGRFLTATLTLPQGQRLDVATARTETYERPGALPAVKPSTMADDMKRRDFTVNAMAVNLGPEDFGELFDPFGGLRDIDSRLIRVLHSKSFIDDPTRLLRAFRLASRLDFSLESSTEALVAAAVESRVFDFVSADRLREELFLGFLEPEPANFFSLLEKHRVLSHLAPGATLDDQLPALLDSAVALNSLVEKGSEWDPSLVFLLLLLRGAGEKDAKLAAARLGLEGRGLDMVKFAPELPRLAGGLERAAAPSEIHSVFAKIPLEVCLASVVMTKGEKQRELAVDYLRRGRGSATELDGDDLIEMGFAEGPAIRRILEELLGQKLDGKVSGRKAEENYVREHFRPPGGEAAS